MTPPQTHSIRTLMLIDDNQIDQSLYQRLIARSGVVETTLSFLSAEDALSHLRNPEMEDPDVILLDINMPRMDGFEFLDAAQKEFGTPFFPVVVMLTTSLDPSDKHRAGTYPAIREFLNKPLTTAHLHQISALLKQT